MQQIEAQRSLGELKREKAALDDLAASLSATQGLAEEAAELQAASLRAQKVVELSTQAAEARCALGSEVRDRLLRAQSESAQDLALETAKLQEAQAAADRSADAIASFFSVYQEKLGLRIERAAPSVVQVEFSLLDAELPGQAASFKLGLSDPQTYCVSDCAPALPKAFLEKLVDRLNRNPSEPSALPAFCCSMRRAFKRALLSKAGSVGGA